MQTETQATQETQREKIEVATYAEASRWCRPSETVVFESEDYVRVSVGTNANYAVLEVLSSFAGNFQPNQVLMNRNELTKLVAELAARLAKMDGA